MSRAYLSHPMASSKCRAMSRCFAAGHDVAYWLDKVYTHLDSGLLTEDDIAEVEALAQAYYDALDAEDKANAEEITL